MECWHLGEHLLLYPIHAFMTIYEWNGWRADYLPYSSIEGLTILDVGAGCGETCHFFLKNSASKVIALESNSKYMELLKSNALENSWNVETVCEPFSPKHLKEFEFDYAKIDIDGGESCLLALDELPRMIMEVHDRSVKELFMKKFGMTVRREERKHEFPLLTNITTSP